MRTFRKWNFFQILLFCLISITIFWNSAPAEENQTLSANIPTVLTMCYLIERNISGTTYDYNKAAASLDLAMDYANNYVLPPEFKLTNVYRNIGKKCSRRSSVVAYAMKLQEDDINCSVYIGPGCGLAVEILFDLVSVWDIPIIGCPASGVGLSAPSSEYNIISRTSITYTSITFALVRFFNAYNYTTPVVFQDQSINFFDQLGLLMQTTIRLTGESLVYGTSFVYFSSARDHLDAIRNQIITSSLSSRVFVLLTNANMVRTIMIMAHKLQMTRGEFIFIAVELYLSDVWGVYSWERNDNFDVVARDAYRSLMILSLKKSTTLAGAEEFWRKVLKLSREKYNFNFSKSEQEEIDPVVAHFYDAVLLYANIVTLMSSRNLNFKSGVDFTKAVANYTFLSPASGRVTFNMDSDRLLDYELRALNERTGKHDAVLGFPATRNDITSLGEFSWVGTNSLPPNTPFCGFRGENPACSPQGIKLTGGQKAAVVVVVLIVVGAFGCFGQIFLKKLVQRNLDPFWWRILEQDLTFNPLGGQSSKSMVMSTHGGSTALSVIQEKEENETIASVTVAPSGGAKTAIYNGLSVSLMDFPEPKQRVSPSLPLEAAMVRSIQHNNVQKFIGIAVNDANLCDYFVSEVCQKGSLQDLIEDQRMQLDLEFKNSLIKDLTNGMVYLHSSTLISHGFLSDTTCYIDSRFILKIGGYGFKCLRNREDLEPFHISQEDRNIRILLWRAPELLRRPMPPSGTQKGDVYSYAILLQQIVLRSDPFQKGDHHNGGRAATLLNAKDIVNEIARGMTPPLRPPVPVSACSQELHGLMDTCWSEDPVDRPAFTRIRLAVQNAIKKSGDNIVDHLIKRMETYASQLETQVETQTRQFMEERQRSAQLLQVILPKSISDAMTKGHTILPETFDSTTVYFSSVVGFKEAVASARTPLETVTMLNNLYSVCDDVIEKFDVFKVEVVIDAYLIVSGLPVKNGTRHAEQIALMAVTLRKEVMALMVTNKTSLFKLRVGIHSGSCVAGVVGLKMPRYCLFGDTVNTASRMESHGEAGKIHCSATTKALLDTFVDFVLVERGITKIKGKGDMMTYWLIGTQ